MKISAKSHTISRCGSVHGALALAGCMAVLSAAQAAVPGSERQALLDLYASTNGAGWTNRSGWGGTAGTECGWYGVQCDTAQEHVWSIDLQQNNLTGSLPSLVALTGLLRFNASDNHLSGAIPRLTGMTSLATFRVSGNQLSGQLPDLSGLNSLVWFSADENRLTGSIPSLQGLPRLRTIEISINQLSGSLPALKGTGLAYFGAGRNRLVGSIAELPESIQWFVVSGNQLSGSLPALGNLANLVVLDVSDNQLSGPLPALKSVAKLTDFAASHNALSGAIPELPGSIQDVWIHDNQLSGALPPLQDLAKLLFIDVSHNKLSGPVPPFGKKLEGIVAAYNDLSGPLPELEGLAALYEIDLSHNRLTGTIPSLKGMTNFWRFDVSWNQLSGQVPDVPEPNKLGSWSQGGAASLRSSLCPNALSAIDNPAWDVATGETPWHQNCAGPQGYVNPNQHGLSGSWAYAEAQSQGLLLEIFPDLVAPGSAYLFAGWFTYAASDSGQRWYSIEGAIDESNDAAPLTIYGYHGGSFASTQPVTREVVGTARMLVSDCAHASFAYTLADGRMGSIPLTRLLDNTNCAQVGDNGAVGRQLLSGSWTDATRMESQGFLFDVDPSGGTFFGGWFTYLADAAGDAGSEAQHWYSLQGTLPSANFTRLTDIGIYDSTDGRFMQRVTPPPRTDQVGTASLVFHDCGKATLTYQFASGPNAGRQGAFEVARLGPSPAGCAL